MPDHQVVDELQRGYKLKDRLLAARDGESRAKLQALKAVPLFTQEESHSD